MFEVRGVKGVEWRMSFRDAPFLLVVVDTHWMTVQGEDSIWMKGTAGAGCGSWWGERTKSLVIAVTRGRLVPGLVVS